MVRLGEALFGLRLLAIYLRGTKGNLDITLEAALFIPQALLPFLEFLFAFATSLAGHIPLSIHRATPHIDLHHLPYVSRHCRVKEPFCNETS